MIRKEKFVPEEYYHIYSRTMFNIPEFENKDNARRLTQTFLLANSTNSSQAFDYLRNTVNSTLKKAVEISRKGERLIDLLCYCVMPNHYHLLVKERKERGITDFIRRCNTSIAKYINIKTNRKGPLFESNFKSKHIDSNEYLLHLSVYIHLNPLDFLSGKEWRSNGLKDWENGKAKLLNYRWSSLKNYYSKLSSTSMSDIDVGLVSGTEIILNQFKNKSNEYENFLKDWAVASSLKEKEIESITID